MFTVYSLSRFSDYGYTPLFLRTRDACGVFSFKLYPISRFPISFCSFEDLILYFLIVDLDIHPLIKEFVRCFL